MFGPASMGVWEGPLVLAWSGSVSPVVTLLSFSLLERVRAVAAGAAAATLRHFARLGLEGFARASERLSLAGLSAVFSLPDGREPVSAARRFLPLWIASSISSKQNYRFQSSRHFGSTFSFKISSVPHG